MKRFLVLLLTMAYWALPSQAQIVYTPDTSLTFTEFIKQCQSFSEDDRHAWVIHFWSYTNSDSWDMIDELKPLRERYRQKPIRFISVSVDTDREYIDKNLMIAQMDWEQLIVTDRSDYEFLRTKAFKHNSLPALYLISPDAAIARLEDTYLLAEDLDVVAGQLPNIEKPLITDIPPVDEENLPVRGGPQGEPNTTEEGEIVHVVTEGDTLFKLFKKYGVTIDAIMERNGLNSSVIKLGDRIVIPVVQ
ncbi:LysM peptidoglycan-binding domain-containing protein [Pontibacter sp. G13]|uniref:LysM peptidoglycan-binding domain-containing protein n=1 Tax=Pontibacter sp. G13 TaxID=3074898 RepID=UPI00288B6706|nr:LysM peptidoglycan-binding domain-containing protein [Pontibacter sp. G13]WNJ16320.1 LysM peptidoglycan-binding domain-containing protein [Pontibacter sp. G13]